MSLSVRALELRITTTSGLFGVRLDFDAAGLNVIRAHNTSGKSTCVQALIYCLGLEAMLTTVQGNPPLQYALLERFQYGDEELAVDESEVLVELINGAGRIITVRRPIVSHSERTTLVNVWEGAYLTEGDTGVTKEDFFVRLEGAAQREKGFHSFLASYLGWELPLVARFDGGDVPLYLECLFPLYVVEQKHGWSGIQSRMPTHFRIREMAKRAIEFSLRLESYAIAAERLKLRENLHALERRWDSSAVELSAKLGVLGGLVRRLPKSPIRHWPPVLDLQCLVFDGKEWQDISKATTSTADRLYTLVSIPVPTANDDAARIGAQLRIAQKELGTLEVLASSVLRDAETESSQMESLDKRIAALTVDLQNYQDVKRLRDIGASVQMSVSSGRCPTCDQSIEDALVPQTGSSAPMTLDENMNFIGGQLRAFSAMRRDSQRVIEGRERSLEGIRAKMQELRSTIRAYKQSLTSSGMDASAGTVRERMVLESNIEKYAQMATFLEEATLSLELLSLEYKEVSERLEGLKDGVSEADEVKLRDLEHSFVSQLEEYGFSSIRPPSLLSISRETYRPTYEGFDLGFNLSASDMIRTIWSYLYGLLEVARVSQTNHPGFLVLDEPRQQQANRISFAMFAKRASTCKAAGQQVIFLTSEEEEIIEGMLQGVEHRYINFPGTMKLIQPMASRPEA